MVLQYSFFLYLRIINEVMVKRGNKKSGNRRGARGQKKFQSRRNHGKSNRNSRGGGGNQFARFGGMDPMEMELETFLGIRFGREMNEEGEMSRLGRMSNFLPLRRQIMSDKDLRTGLKFVSFVKAKQVYDPSADLLRKIEGKEMQGNGGRSSPYIETKNSDKALDQDPRKESESLTSKEVESSEWKSACSVVSGSEDEISYTDNVSEDDLIKEEGVAEVRPRESLEDNTEHTSLQEAPELDHDSVLRIAKISLQSTEQPYCSPSNGSNSSETAKEIVQPYSESEGEFLEQSDDESNYDQYKSYIANVMRSKHLEDDDDTYLSDTNFDNLEVYYGEKESSEEDDESDNRQCDPEYGFLPEDYEFDTSQMQITNVRFGISNQYYAKCYELTGLMEDFTWIDEIDLFDFVLLKGVQEHRLKSFLKYMTNGMLESDDEQAVGFDSDVYVSDSSDALEVYQNETIESDLDDQLGEGLEELLEFSRKNKKNALENLGTSSLRTTGKGSKQRLDLEQMDLDDEIKSILQSQFLRGKSSKSLRKERKKDEAMQLAILNHDLLVKYPYSLHIRDIKKELDALFEDRGREVLTFPPLDPHGNKTIIKLSRNYNMKALRCGSGKHRYIKIAKSRKTYHNLPNYNMIDAILRQRPIFNRMDSKKPRDEASRKNKSKANLKGGEAHHKEGDIIGAYAPEISSENFGRQILEKLGWVQGEGLGVNGNKGISEPLMARVKKSKQGLRTM